MIKEYAIEKVEENKNQKPVDSEWINEKTGSDRYIAMFLCRSFNLRDKRDLLIVSKIFKAYSFNFDFKLQAEKATVFFNDYNRSGSLDYLTVLTLRMLADKVDKVGLDPLLNALPVSAFDEIKDQL